MFSEFCVVVFFLKDNKLVVLIVFDFFNKYVCVFETSCVNLSPQGWLVQ